MSMFQPVTAGAGFCPATVRLHILQMYEPVTGTPTHTHLKSTHTRGMHFHHLFGADNICFRRKRSWFGFLSFLPVGRMAWVNARQSILTTKVGFPELCILHGV